MKVLEREEFLKKLWKNEYFLLHCNGGIRKYLEKSARLSNFAVGAKHFMKIMQNVCWFTGNRRFGLPIAKLAVSDGAYEAADEFGDEIVSSR